jgi:hypothetical protein
MTRAASLIQRTAHGQSAASQPMRVHHSCFHILMSEEFLDRPAILSLLEQMRRKAVSKGITTDAFSEPRRTTRPTDGSLQSTLIGVMPADGPRAGVSR